MLIPFHGKGGKLGYDLSALNNANQKALLDSFATKGDFVTEVFIERQRNFIHPTQNLLIDNHTKKPILPSGYTENIIEGFLHYMHWLIDNKVAVLDFLNKSFMNLKSRILFRPTAIYTKILIESYHPKLLSSFKEYQDYFTQLDSSAKVFYKVLYPHELKDLFNGDIPYFSTKTTSLVVKNSKNQSVEWALKCSGFQRVVNKIKLIDESYATKIAHEIIQSLKDRYAPEK